MEPFPMTEEVAPKSKLPRKTVQVTYASGASTTFDSIKVATEETGHSPSKLMRYAATGEADENGDTYQLVDYVPKKGVSNSFTLSDAFQAKLIAAAVKADKKVPVYIREIVEQHLA
jgi:hypothetical protein